MDGTTRAKRIADDRLDIMLLVRLNVERRGRAWEQHPLSRPPKRVIVSEATGRPTLLYGLAGPVSAYSLWPGRRVSESILTGSIAFHATYSETGRVTGRRIQLLGNPQWN